MAKKSAISGEYIITVEDSNAGRVCKIAENVKGAMRECAEKNGMEYDPNWTTRQFGAKLIKQFGEGNLAEVGEFTITKRESGSFEIYQVFGNTKAALREISEKIGFEYDPKWNTQNFASKLVDFINSNK